MDNNPKQRLVLVVPAFPRYSETFIVTKFLGLIQRGWDVHIVCSEFVDRDWLKFPQLAADLSLKQRIHVCWPQKQKWLALLLLLPALMRAILTKPVQTFEYFRKGLPRFKWGIFKRFYLDLELICLSPGLIHFEFGALAVGRTYLKHLLNAKLTVSFRGYDLNFAGLDTPGYYDEVWRTADAAHFLGRDLWQRAQQRGCPRDFPHVFIPPALDLAKFVEFDPKPLESISTPSRPLRVLSVGRLEWKKGYEFALQAVKLLLDEGIRLEYRVVGDGEYKHALYFARRQLGLENQISFLGAVPHERVLAQLAWADIFLHAAVSEGFCNAVLEAQAAGLPVVCSDADGLAENVADGLAGFVVPRRSPSALAEKIALLAQDAPLRQLLGSAGRERVAQLFQLESHLSAWENFYQQLS